MDMVDERRRKPPRGVASLRLDEDEWVALMYGRKKLYALLTLIALAAGATLWVSIETHRVVMTLRADQQHGADE